MKCLLLGGAGFIGSALARRLVAEAHEIMVVDDFSRGQRNRLPSQCSIMPADLRTDGWRLAMRQTEWDWLFVLAGVVGVPNVERDPERTWQVTARAVLGMLDIPARKTFFASTSEVYGGNQAINSELGPVMVPEILRPRAVYAISKLWGEQALIHSGRQYLIGRFHNIYGPAMGTDHVIPRFCLQLLTLAGPLHVDDPTAVRAFCFIDDAVEAIVAGMRLETSDILNIGNPHEPITMEALMDRLKRIAGQPDRPVTEGNLKLGFPRARIPETARLHLLTGFEPRVRLDDGLQRTWEAYRG